MTRYNYVSVNKIITMTWLFMAIEGWTVKASKNVFACIYGICTYTAFIIMSQEWDEGMLGPEVQVTD